MQQALPHFDTLILLTLYNSLAIQQEILNGLLK